jgi:hypothetical protein
MSVASRGIASPLGKLPANQTKIVQKKPNFKQ